MAGLTAELRAAAWDCHVHVFDPARYPLTKERVYTPGPALTADLDQHLNGLGIGQVVLVQPSPYADDNRCLLEALSVLGPERARGIAVLEPDEITPERIAEFHAAGIRGLRCNFKTTGQTDTSAAARTVDAIDERLGETPWTLQTFTPLAMNLALAPTLARLSRPVILDHFAGLTAADLDRGDAAALIDLVKHPNIIIKLSAAHRVAGHQDAAPVLRELAETLMASAPDQLIWGTDWPHTGSSTRLDSRPLSEIEPFEAIDDEVALATLGGWCPSSDLTRKILVDTPSRLFTA